MLYMQDKIDLVITWVDGSDQTWLKERKKYETTDLDSNSVGEQRFRDWGILKYWFRSIEKNAPFVKNIYFVTYGHVPQWLNQKHPQIRIIKHSDYMPKEYLPTYNSVAIELNFHRIPGIGKQFVYFNDDMFLLQPTTMADYFAKDGKIKYNLIESAMTTTGELDPVYRDMLLNTIEIVNKSHKKRRFKNLSFRDPIVLYNNLKAIAFKKYIGYAPHHFSRIYDRKIMEDLWESHRAILDKTSQSKFRTKDIITPDLIELTQAALGMTRTYYSRKREKFLGVNKDSLNHVIKTIKTQSVKEVCLNDACTNEDFDYCREEVAAAFEEIFPEKSKYEL